MEKNAYVLPWKNYFRSIFFFNKLDRQSDSPMDAPMINKNLIELTSWLMSFQENVACQTVQVMVFGVSSKATKKQKKMFQVTLRQIFFLFFSKNKSQNILVMINAPYGHSPCVILLSQLAVGGT